MIEIVNAIIIITLIFIIYKYFEAQSYDITMVKSNINGKSYLVRNLENKQEAADLLAAIAVKLERLVNIMYDSGYETIYTKYMKTIVDKEIQTDKDISDKKKDINEGQDGGSSSSTLLENTLKKTLREDIERLKKNFNPDAFSETTPDAKYTSYSVNKGEKIVFCLRDKKEGEKLVKENIMTFVSIHELAHLMTKSIGHEPDFWANFKLLLKVSIDNGLYKNIDFNSTPKPYCGINITDTPLKPNEI
tara:strand:- start:356 stop:1096 length:741 start_codon:yes stop_codon:yes gene_type:complete